MATYDLKKLQDNTDRYADDPGAKIPCPDCCDRGTLTVAEDQPVVAALLSYCSLCDGEQYVSKSRALAVLPHVVAYVKELRSSSSPNIEEKECQKP